MTKRFKLTPEQIEDVKSKDWDVIPEAQYVTIYASERDSGFAKICEAMKIKPSGDMLSLLVIGTAMENEDEQN